MAAKRIASKSAGALKKARKVPVRRKRMVASPIKEQPDIDLARTTLRQIAAHGLVDEQRVAAARVLLRLSGHLSI